MGRKILHYTGSGKERLVGPMGYVGFTGPMTPWASCPMGPWPRGPAVTGPDHPGRPPASCLLPVRRSSADRLEHRGIGHKAAPSHKHYIVPPLSLLCLME